jgi:hypothetical protein
MPLTIEMFSARRVVKTYVVERMCLRTGTMLDSEEVTSEIDALTWADAMNRIDARYAYYVREN